MTARKPIRKLVTLTPGLAEAIERFRDSEEMQRRRCPGCGAFLTGARDDRPSESDTIRRLIELGFEHRATAS